MQTKSKWIIGICAIFIVAIMLFTPWGSNILPLASSDYGTGRTVNTVATKATVSGSGGSIPIDNPYLTVQNALNHNDVGEIFDSSRYVVSWAPGEYSKAITARVDAMFKTRYDRLYSLLYGLGEFPTTYVKNDYWWQVTYTDFSGVSTRIIDGKNYTGVSGDTSLKTDYVHVISGYPRRTFPNTKIQEADVPTANRETGWFAPANSPASTETVQLETETFVFEMKGNHYGTLNIKCYLADSQFATVDTDGIPIPGIAQLTKIRHFQKTGPVLLSEDNAYLPSGRGEVRVDSVGAIKNDGTDKSGGTGITYTKYVFQEGDNISFSMDTGYSGTALESDQVGYKEGWSLQIINSKGTTIKTYPIGDGLKNYKIKWQIPKGSFIANDPNDNEWMVVLSNTMYDQSESRLFVIDSYAKMPGTTTLAVTSNQVDQFQKITFTASAKGNPVGTNDVNHFRIWATYSSPTSTNYALTARNYPASLSGGVYKATDSFQVSQGDKTVYITAVAVDSQGRAGVEGEQQVYVKQVIPNPNPNPFIPVIGSDTWIIIALIGVVAIAGVASYFILKRKKGGSSKPVFKLPKWGKKK